MISAQPAPRRPLIPRPVGRFNQRLIMSNIFVLINLALLPAFIFILKRFHLWFSLFFLVIVALEGIFVAFDILIFFTVPMELACFP